MKGIWGAAALAVAIGCCAPAGAQQVTPAPAGTQADALTPAETVWHLRAALNVAALGCRGAEEAATVAGYNALLATQRAALATASDVTAAHYKARFGAAWQARLDDDMTRLYNFWARPAAHDRFCAAASAVLRDISVVEPGAFEAFALAALPRLEQPFAPAAVPDALPAPILTAVEETPTVPAAAATTVLAMLAPVASLPANQ